MHNAPIIDYLYFIVDGPIYRHHVILQIEVPQDLLFLKGSLHDLLLGLSFLKYEEENFTC